MRRILLIVLAIPCLLLAQSEKEEDTWAPLRALVGTWEGTGGGGSATSQVTAEYRFVLGESYLELRHKAIFPPQEGKPEGEIHEDFGIISYDRSRKKFVFRQFHVEGFVNRYTLDSLSEDGNFFLFNAEEIENAPPGTQAQFILEISGENALRTSFNVAFPERELQCYSRNILDRKK
jgi:hypothetical protein